MALEVDRAISETRYQMEQRNSGRWKTKIPGFVRSGQTRPHTQSTDEDFRKTPGQERDGNKKTVTMALTSRYMTGRSQYIVRKPLIGPEPQTSILKNPITQECSEREGSTSNIPIPRYNKLRENSRKQSDKDCPDGASKTSPSVSREDPDTMLHLSDLQLSPSYEDPISGSVLPGSTSSLSSPLDIQSLTVPLSPKWASTQRPHTHSYSAPSVPSRKTKMLDTRVGDSLLNTVSSFSYSKNHRTSLKRMSPYQASYWACAIPSSQPPSPDRKSPNWDPDKEYLALLDYTYPLRPNATSTLGLSEFGSLLRTDPLLLDSGIELDRFCSSSSLSGLDQSLNVTWRGRGSPGRGQRSLELQGLNQRELSYSKSSDARLSSSLFSSVEQVGLSVDSLDSEGRLGRQWLPYRKLGIFSTSKSPPTVIPSTRVLPSPRTVGEWDEEFLRLPEQLKELQVLSQQLRDITAQVSQPVTASWESLDRETASGSSLAAQAEKRMAQGDEVDEEQRAGEGEEGGPVCEAHLEGVQLSGEVKKFDTSLGMISREVNTESLREVETIMDQLSGDLQSEFQRKTQMDKADMETRESLMQHIQEFCSNLQKLIEWLYKVVEKMEVLSPPTVDIESVKASLADYKNFQKDVHAHQPLTAAVLQTGEMLLQVMNSTSPALKETLVLIEKQSHALEMHSEHLFSSILSAMDSLTEPGLQCSQTVGE
ncbi:centrosomal protein of 68 kDa [Chanos chanos]|uniref:Centrosomal protein of 68 kDa n=1 Tax=Chanos chanos TaxID=29144 RepID=A0A6J2V561_CHACN|nr:centrosomal protein of 68 kDa [Chanos chanos]